MWSKQILSGVVIPRHYYSTRDLFLPRRRQCHSSRYILSPICRHLWAGKHTWFFLTLFCFCFRDERLHHSLYNREPSTDVESTYPSSSHVSSCCDCTLTTWYVSVLETDIELGSSYRRHYYSRRDLYFTRRMQGHS